MAYLGERYMENSGGIEGHMVVQRVPHPGAGGLGNDDGQHMATPETN